MNLLLWNYTVCPLAFQAGKLYNLNNSEVVGDPHADREGSWWSSSPKGVSRPELEASTAESCRSRLRQMTKKGECRVERSRVRTVTAQADEHVSCRVRRIKRRIEVVPRSDASSSLLDGAFLFNANSRRGLNPEERRTEKYKWTQNKSSNPNILQR